MTIITLIPKKLSLTPHKNGWRVRLYAGDRRYETAGLSASDVGDATIEAFGWYEARLTNKDKVAPQKVHKLSRLIDDYIEYQSVRCSSGEITHYTLNRNRLVLKIFTRWWKDNGSVRIDKIASLYDTTYASWRLNEYAAKPTKWNGRSSLTNKSLSVEVVTHKGFWFWCVKSGYAVTPITLKIKINRDQKRAEFPIRYYRKLLQHIRNSARKANTRRVRISRLYLYHLVMILAHTGMRPEEARNLKWGDIRKMDSYGLVQCKGKKHTGSIVVPLKVLYYFDRLKQIVLLNNYNKNVCHIDDQPVFQTVDGDRNVSLYRKAWRASLAAIGLSNKGDGKQVIGLYSFRHLKISQELRRGVSIYDCAIGNRTSVQMIEQTYSHLTAASRHEQLLKGIPQHSTETQVSPSDKLLEMLK